MMMMAGMMIKVTDDFVLVVDDDIDDSDGKIIIKWLQGLH